MQKIEFTGSQGHKLAARLDTPEGGEIKSYALFAHCFTCSKDIFAAGQIARALNALGIAVLRFDFTGLGASEGEFENTNFTSNVQDLVKAADYMREHLQAPRIIIGHSLGGAAVIMAAHSIPEIKAVATIGAPADAAHVSHHFESAREEIIEKGEAKVQLVGRPFTIKKQFIDDIESQNMDDAIRTLKKPLLVLHAPLDDTVGIENASHIFATAKHPKSFVTLDTADHLLTNREDAIYAARMIAAWASRYVGYKLTYNHLKKPLKGNDVSVKTAGPDTLKQYVQIGKHLILADEPEDKGGENTGPDPYGLLMAALGACTAMTLQLYARRKELPLEGAEIYLSHEKVEGTDKFTREIVIQGEHLSEDQRTRMMEIADKCPVHKTLTGEVIIETTRRERAKKVL